MACQWRVSGTKERYFWNCSKGKSGGPFRRKVNAVEAALKHGECP